MKWMCVRPTYYLIVIFNFVHFISAVSDNNIDPVVILWYEATSEERKSGNKAYGASAVPCQFKLRCLLCFERT